MALTITYVGHATVLIDDGATRLLTDPLLRRRLGHLRRMTPAPDVAALRGVDAVLVSHVHGDHLDPRSLRSVHARRVVVPAGAARWRGLRRVAGVQGIRAGERVAVGGGRVLAVRSEHGRRRGLSGLAADPLGYVVEGEQRVYFAGDTGLFDGMGELGPIDVALLPIWGWGPRVGPGHLDPARAVEALRLLRPRIAIPIHWGTYVAVSVLRRRRELLRDPPLAFAAAAARGAPDVEVRVLQPGEALRLAADPRTREDRRALDRSVPGGDASAPAPG